MNLWANYRQQRYKKVRVFVRGASFTAVAISDDSLADDDIVIVQRGASIHGGVNIVRS